ncbi:MAG: beta-glucosidase, partial [Actinomycetales bacterium]|nr:beta-glucosidase [Actinomycetales bacterium]
QAEQLGAEAAAQAVRRRHAVLEPGPVAVVDVRLRAQHASGARSQQLIHALRERDVRAEELDRPDRVDSDEQLLVLTRLPRSDEEEGQRLADLLARRPDAIVVHTGVPDAAPDHRRLVLAHGGGRTMMRAAVQLMLEEER